MNNVVCDSGLERDIAREVEADDRVAAYVKNDRLFCEIPYRFNGRTSRYIPDFLVRLPGDQRLLIEGKGRETAKDHHKETAAHRWVAAVNGEGRWGGWSHHVVRHRSEVRPLIDAVLAEVVSTPA